MPKLAFMFAENNNFVGKWDVLPIGLHEEYINSLESKYNYVDVDCISSLRINRDKFSHKGAYGHALIISGSYGKMGAAILAARACLKSGSGLVTAHIPKLGYSIMQTAIPEAMISIDISDIIITDIPNVEAYTSVGIGPGIGTKPNTVKALSKLFDEVNKPMLLDADALNILSENQDLIKKIPENSIITPHVKEFERLVGVSSSNYNRMQQQIDFSIENKLFVVLKGAHSSISCPDGSVYFNSTGNPGMATAGSGDVLSGIILSLLGQNFGPKNAAIYGVYLHGLAGDLAAEIVGEESLIASDIIDNIGNAYLSLK